MPLCESIYEESGDEATKSEQTPPPPPPPKGTHSRLYEKGPIWSNDETGKIIKKKKKLPSRHKRTAAKTLSRIRLPETEGRGETPKEV